MEERNAELLAVPYFHVVFTLPARLAAIGYQNVSLRRAPRRSSYRSSGRSQIRLLPIPRQ
jgi:hypothetical protein